MVNDNSRPEEGVGERFERLYRAWRRHVEQNVLPYSSSDRDYIQNPYFDAIVDLGDDALPFIMEKFKSDEYAHFFIHALVRITGKHFSLDELNAHHTLAEGPLGNQAFVRYWLSWWDSQQSRKDVESHNKRTQIQLNGEREERGSIQ